jgi:hypothetical protein
MTDKKLKYILTISICIMFLLPAFLSAKGTGQEKKGRLQKTTQGTQIGIAAMDINNLNALQSNLGYSDYNPNNNLEGTIYPKGTGRNAIFTSGFLWAGYPNGDTSQVYTGGSAYGSNLQAGPLLSDGHPSDPTDPKWSIYRVRPDVYPGGPDVDLSGDAAASSYWNPAAPLTPDQVKQQYIDDWNNWPAAGTSNDLGAPFTDVNGDGKYEPGIDIPGVHGADQTIFYVANDENADLGSGLYGAPPLGVEVHVTMWAYAQQGALGNMYFKKYDIINKGYQKYSIDSMFVTWWADVDLGSSSDDLVGNDTTLSLTYVYNGEPTDATYNPLPPPCTGADFFQGPVVPGTASDSAIYKGKIVHGMRNLPMTAAYTFTNPGSGLDSRFNDPDLYVLTGSTQFYHFMNGQNRIGGAFVDPQTGKASKFIFPGDPTATSNKGWVDGSEFPPRDVRSGMASGPVTMAPGDTQEVVVAEIVAGAVPGVSYLDAITLLKVYDKTAQNAYDHFFNLPSAPPAPHVIATAGNNKVILDWGENSTYTDATEKSEIADKIDSVDVTGGGSYKFEGYNVYQLPSFGASKDEAKLVATYDVINNITTIPYTDPVTRTVEPSISIQSGSDAGVKRFIADSVDVFNGNKPMVNGLPYYFAVTAYSYNPKGVPQSLENPISTITVTPHSPNPGITYTKPGDFSSSLVKHSGTANATADVVVTNPSQVTGDQYQISFHNEMYSLGSDAKWTDVTAASKKMAKLKDLTGSSITPTAAYSENKGHVNIHYLVDVESANYDWCDGVKLQLPAGLAIDSIYDVISNNTGDVIPYTYDKNTNTLFYSVVDPDSLMSGDSTYRTQGGVFAGGEDIQLLVHGATLPMVTNYDMYDDNFGAENGYGGKLVDVSGTDTLKTIANQVITQHQWNVTDTKTSTVVLKNQTIYGGTDIYAPVDYKAANGITGPGGSSGSQTGKVGAGANPTFDGVRAAIDGSFAAPTTYDSLIINGTSHGSGEVTQDGYDIYDFDAFGFPDGTANSSITSYGGVGGATSIDALQQDYELKWTGVTADTTINGQTVVITKSGGSYATIFGASNYSIADHPLNPSPGTKAPFLIRIPFEVWNTTKNEQVNLLLYDRNAASTNQPGVAADTFQVWNTRDRVYVWAMNTKYSAAVIDPTSSIVADSATWNWVFFTSAFKTGDDIKFTYANPLQIGKDTFTFTVPAEAYSESTAKQDINKINIFPNPYYGVNSQELSKYSRFVTFNHLPSKTAATIRIFNLAGYEVRVIQHTNGTQFETWDLNNKSGLPVSSGIYIAYVDMPTLGQKKILKFAIIQEQQAPDHF